MAITSFTMDFREFDKKMKKMNDDMTKTWEEQGMKKALDGLQKDAEDVPPTVPKKIGTLRSEVDLKTKIFGIKGVEGIIVYKMAYAIKLHEAPEDWNWTETGSGPKFLYNKLIVFGKDYRDIIGLHLKNKLR